MAIQAQVYPEMNSGLGFYSDYYGGAGYNFEQFGLSHQKRQRLEQGQYMQQLFKNQQNLVPLEYVEQKNMSAAAAALNTAESQRISIPFDQQGQQEIDQYLVLQSERLKLALHERTQQQEAILVKTIEAKAQFLIQQKDNEIAEAFKRTVELENLLSKLEMEKRAWQTLAQEKEVMILSLNNTLEQLRSNRLEESAESYCENSAKETEKNGDGDHGGSFNTVNSCRRCNNEESCMVFLPCRHLCSCKACDGFLESCPVCGVAKKATIEALVS